MLKKLPIDTNVLGLIAAGPAEPVVDFESRQPRCDANGTPLYAVTAMALAFGDSEVIAIKVPGEPKGITAGTVLKVTGLVAVPWEMDDRSGTAYRAAGIEAATTGAAGGVKGAERVGS